MREKQPIYGAQPYFSQQLYAHLYLSVSVTARIRISCALYAALSKRRYLQTAVDKFTVNLLLKKYDHNLHEDFSIHITHSFS